MRRYKLTEREPSDDTVHQMRPRFEDDCWDGNRLTPAGTNLAHYRAAHDAAPSDLTEAVEALVRASDRGMRAANSSAWVGAQQQIADALDRIRTIAPDFYKQAMEQTDER